MEYRIELWGLVPSKKNFYMPRRDRPGMFKHSALQTELDRLAIQIPGELRDLNLEHPDIHFHFTVPKEGKRRDRDNMVTTLMDLLVAYRVLRSDNINRCNGTLVIHPATIGKDYQTVIVLEVKDESA